MTIDTNNTYMLATKMRDDLIHDGQKDKLEHLVEEARKLQDTLQSAAAK